ncbi:TetR family transcriptional regulator [Lactococcus hodotermopsidis]|uniref:TetR family transcriptional regulator n=1 Tax=Pseudolactococcus hodotermopsidis TaxID=2709157 RepID=A0A6A0BAL8_9LACT|nr:TetR/AcrR family transcriptional regulator [Lactococcus hodotermopsidis]GFH41501.1 TetR family transcriptional regulator [Lactococcus hodotermopsidis]
MVRTKKIFKEDILAGAEEFVIKETAEKFTARALAEHMEISTQPLYQEFSSMDELKEAVLHRVLGKVQDDIFNKKHHSDSLINLVINYIKFSKHSPELFTAVYSKNFWHPDLVNDFSQKIFQGAINKDEKYRELSHEKRESLSKWFSVISMGISQIVANDDLQLSLNEIIDFFERVLGVLEQIWQENTSQI